MNTKEHPIETEITAKQLVLSFITSLNDLYFRSARELVKDDLKFEGVLNSRNGADEYFDDLEKMKLRFDVHKVFADGDDVCLLYDVHMSGLIIFSCAWFQVEENKISSIRVIFDPRPVLELPEQKS